MRRGLGFPTMIAFVLVLLALVSTQWDAWKPPYEPRHHLLQWTFAAAAGYLFATYHVARAVAHRTLGRVLKLQIGLAVVVVVVFLAYHHHHAAGPQPAMRFWDVSEPVTPFHQQLA